MAVNVLITLSAMKKYQKVQSTDLSMSETKPCDMHHILYLY